MHQGEQLAYHKQTGKLVVLQHARVIKPMHDAIGGSVQCTQAVHVKT